MARARRRRRGPGGSAARWRRTNMGYNPGWGRAWVIGGGKAGTRKRRKGYVTSTVSEVVQSPFTLGQRVVRTSRRSVRAVFGKGRR